MSTKIIFLLLSFLISCNSFSQTEEFSDWLGEWSANYVNNLNHKQEENLTIKWIHFERWFQIESTGQDLETEYKWSSSMVLTLDNELKIVGWYIDESGYMGMATIKGVVEDNKLVLKFESRLWSDKTTWLLKDGKLYRKGKSKFKQTGQTSTDEHMFTKKP